MLGHPSLAPVSTLNVTLLASGAQGLSSCLFSWTADAEGDEEKTGPRTPWGRDTCLPDDVTVCLAVPSRHLPRG